MLDRDRVAREGPVLFFLLLGQRRPSLKRSDCPRAGVPDRDIPALSVIGRDAGDPASSDSGRKLITPAGSDICLSCVLF
jgi:hypothetical protein